MSHDTLLQAHEPGPDCPRFAALLPMLDDDTVDPDDAAHARAHLVGCAYCRAQRAAYDRVDAGLRRHFGAALATPLSMEGIMSTILDDSDSDSDTVTPGAIPPSLAKPSHPIRPRRRRALSGLAALAAVLILSLLATVLFISHPRVAPVTTQQPFAVPTGAALILTGVSMVSSNEGWAVGTYTPPMNADGTPTTHEKSTGVLFHFLNGTWTRVNGAVPSQSAFYAISMDSPTDGWAVGDVAINGGASTLLLHYDGRAWRQVSNSLPTVLFDVQMLSADDGWAVSGVSNDGANVAAAIYHYDGTSWTAQTVPSVSIHGQHYDLQLSDLSMTSPDDGWVVGLAIPPTPATGNSGSCSGSQAGVILHYTGGTWRIQQLIPNAVISGIAMDAPGDGWAVGVDVITQQITGDSGTYCTESQHMLLFHYTAGHWVNVPVPRVDPQRLSGDFRSIIMSSPTDGWIIGNANGTTTTANQAANSFVLLHYDGTSWTEVATPNIKGPIGHDITVGYDIYSFSVPAPNDVWAVGSALSTPDHYSLDTPGAGPISTTTPVILHYHDGAWVVYSS